MNDDIPLTRFLSSPEHLKKIFFSSHLESRLGGGIRQVGVSFLVARKRILDKANTLWASLLIHKHVHVAQRSVWNPRPSQIGNITCREQWGNNRSYTRQPVVAKGRFLEVGLLTQSWWFFGASCSKFNRLLVDRDLRSLLRDTTRLFGSTHGPELVALFTRCNLASKGWAWGVRCVLLVWGTFPLLHFLICGAREGMLGGLLWVV